jgi:hypothetical protein
MNEGTGYKKSLPEWQALLVPPTGVISNSFLEDLERIWSLRDVIPDPDKTH